MEENKVIRNEIANFLNGGSIDDRSTKETLDARHDFKGSTMSFEKKMSNDFSGLPGSGSFQQFLQKTSFNDSGAKNY